MNTPTGKLSLVMRLAEEREISTFELAPGETLSQRVKAEIAKAAVDGKLKGLASRAGLPVAAVRESLADGTGINSVALFTADGEEVTDRAVTLAVEDGMFLLTGVNDDKQELLGAFPDEDLANRIGCLWKAGLI